MYPHANTGNEVNNKKLSPCSTEIMGPILTIRGTCFMGERIVVLGFEHQVTIIHTTFKCNCDQDVTEDGTHCAPQPVQFNQVLHN